MVSEAADQGTMAPDASLHLSVIERPYKEGEDALEAIAADQINCFLLASAYVWVQHNLRHWELSNN